MIRKSLVDTSVIISTFHRPKSILTAITSLQKQTATNFEIIVVGCNDKKTENIINKFNKKAKIEIKYINESRLGLHHARHTGAKNAKGSLLIYTDDDCTFSPNWIKSYWQYFIQNPGLVASGGPVIPRWEIPRPEWLVKLMGKTRTFLPYSLMNLGKNLMINKNGFFFGGNMAIRKDILFEVHGFNPDNFGGELLGDGDTGLNNKLKNKNLLIGYIPGAVVYHHITKERMSKEYLLTWMDNQGRCDIYSLYYGKKIPKNLIEFLKFVPKLIYINLRFWFGTMFTKKWYFPKTLNLRMRIRRTVSQLNYVKKLMDDQELRKIVSKQNWL